MSLGRASLHDFGEKMYQASQVGFSGVEIFFEDLEKVASRRTQTAGDSFTNESALLAAAQEVKDICNKHRLEVICLQPFLFYEGLTDREEHSARIVKLKTWFMIAKILETDIIQVPSNFQPQGTSGDMDLIVNDMREIAQMGLQESPIIRFAFENLAWANHISTWEDLWEVVKRVDLPNFGCCLDTFNIAGKVWADPTSDDGKLPGADDRLNATLEQLVRTIDVTKVFYIQVVDAERLAQPLVKGHPYYVEGQPSRMSWSRNARCFAYEEDRGGYLPVVQVAKSFVHGLGYSGWISMELFSRTMSEPGQQVSQEHAQRGYQSWQKLSRELGLVG